MRVLLCRRPVSWESHPNLSVKRSKGLRERDLPQTLLAVFIRRTRRSEERNLLMERVYCSGAGLEMRINNSERNRCSSRWSRLLHFSLSKTSYRTLSSCSLTHPRQLKRHIALLTNNVKTRNIRVLDYRLRTIRLDIRAQHIDNSFETATVVAVQID